jgi:hypothetical protein
MTALRDRCRQVLEGNWNAGERDDGVSFAYTCPSPERYPWQWYWDSCFAAIAWRHLDPSRSRAELETLLAAARPDGFIGHTIFWEAPLRGPRALFYNVIHRDDAMTATIQPPALAFAWSVAVGDPAREPRIVAHTRRSAPSATSEGDGLLWDPAAGRVRSGCLAAVRPDLALMCAGPARLPRAGVAQPRAGFRFEARADGDRSSARCHERDPLGSRWRWGPADHPGVDRTARTTTRAAVPAGGHPAVDERIPITWAALSARAARLTAQIGHRLVEYLLDERRFWTALAPPAVALDEPLFSMREHFNGLRRYWRGPTWVNSAWLLWRGLVRLGYEEQAATIARAITETVAREGLREFYGPRDGHGMGAKDFAWSALALELLKPSNASAGTMAALA